MTSSVDLLVIGGSGFIGANLTQAAVCAGLKVAYTYSFHKLQLPANSFQVNLLEENTLEACLAKTQPKNIVYCAVPRGEEKIHQTVSTEGVTRTLNALNMSFSPKFVYVSSNAVFTGKKGKYREIDQPDAKERHDDYRAYAITRAAGEQIALGSWHNTIIVRTADVNGRDIQGKLNSRLANLVEQLKSGQEIQRLSQAYISPTLVDDLVDGIMEVVNENFSYRGVLHIAGSQRISYYEFARELAKFINADDTLVKADKSRVWDISLDTNFTQSMLKTKLLNVEDQFKKIFS
jgi:dTDP-4-dehydrorhamnose reductase